MKYLPFKQLKWEGHYTGIDVAVCGWLYLQRDRKTQRLQFARLAPEGRWAKWLGYAMLGIFLGYVNHVNREKGVEIFTKDIHFGFTRRNIGCRISWSGSVIDPRYAYSICLWHFFIGGTTDKWLKKIIDARVQRRMEKEYDEEIASWGLENEEWEVRHEHEEQ